MTDSCLNCALAEWYKTKSGRLHPSGDGECQWRFEQRKIPKAFYYIGTYDNHAAPAPSGGYINRRKAYENCATFEGREVEE